MNKKSTFLKVMGIICTIFGGIRILFAFYEISTFQSLYEKLLPVAYYDLIYAAFMLAAGILGIIYSSRYEKKTLCMILGIIMVVLEIVGYIILASILSGTYISFTTVINPIAIIFRMTLPVLYLVATFRYTDAASYGQRPYGGQQMYGQQQFNQNPYGGQQQFNQNAYGGQQQFNQNQYGSQQQFNQNQYGGQPQFNQNQYGGQQQVNQNQYGQNQYNNQNGPY